MQQFERNQNVLAGKEARRIIRLYNKIAQTLVTFELRWHEAWVASVERAKSGAWAFAFVLVVAGVGVRLVTNTTTQSTNPKKHRPGLHATLLVRHPDDGRLYVNLDQEIPQLVREAKCLERMGIEVRCWLVC